jgi:hypothetical protein
VREKGRDQENILNVRQNSRETVFLHRVQRMTYMWAFFSEICKMDQLSCEKLYKSESYFEASIPAFCKAVIGLSKRVLSNRWTNLL